MLNYPQGQVQAQFQTPYGTPLGACADQNGNVFVSVETGGGGDIFEYAHGGTSPIATLDDYDGTPAACFVDPTTGNLAVANQDSGRAGLDIYQNAQGGATYYSDPNVYAFYFCTYDDDGNLFVDGEGGSPLRPTLSELPSRGSSFTEIALNKKIGRPGSLQWMGTYLAMGGGTKTVYHVKISGSAGDIVGKTPVHASTYPSLTYTIDGKTLISTYGSAHRKRSFPDRVAYYEYPKGGAPTELLGPFHGSVVTGVAISVGQDK
jgi:hypothetical protein